MQGCQCECRRLNAPVTGAEKRPRPGPLLMRLAEREFLLPPVTQARPRDQGAVTRATGPLTDPAEGRAVKPARAARPGFEKGG